MNSTGVGQLRILPLKRILMAIISVLLMMMVPLCFAQAIPASGRMSLQRELLKPPVPQLPQSPQHAVQVRQSAPAPYTQEESPARSAMVEQAGSVASPPEARTVEPMMPVTAQAEAGKKVVPAEDQPLTQVYRDNRQRHQFTTTGYMLRVFGVMALLLGAFYLFARFVMPRWLEGSGGEPLIPFSKRGISQARKAKPSASSETAGTKGASLLKSLLLPVTVRKDDPLRPKILSRTRLGPAKEVFVLKVGDRQLVVGATSQQMTLLAEIPAEKSSAPAVSDDVLVSASRGGEKEIYKKYLSKQPMESFDKSFSAIPEEEEIFLLEDYDDHFDHS